LPKTIKGYMWFEEISGRNIKIDGVSLLGNNKGATRYAAIVLCKTRDMAKDFCRKVKEKDMGPRAKLLNNDDEVEKFRQEMIKNKGWSKDAPDGDKAINKNTGADIRGDASGFSHGFNPYKRSRSRSRRRSPTPPRRAAQRRSRSRSRSPKKSESRSRRPRTCRPLRRRPRAACRSGSWSCCRCWASRWSAVAAGGVAPARAKSPRQNIAVLMPRSAAMMKTRFLVVWFSDWELWGNSEF